VASFGALLQAARNKATKDEAMSIVNLRTMIPLGKTD
jgi:hypothetical protein